MSVANPFNVRRATPADIDALRAVVPAIIAETTLLPPSPTRIEMLIQRCTHQIGGSIAGIIDGAEGVSASIGLCFTQDVASDEPYITAVWCGLAPNARQTDKQIAIDDPRRHYGRKLFEFAKWCHATLEEKAEQPILMRFDLLTTDKLGPKMGLYQRNLQQVGASFAFGAIGAFRQQPVPEEVAA